MNLGVAGHYQRFAFLVTDKKQNKENKYSWGTLYLFLLENGIKKKKSHNFSEADRATFEALEFFVGI